MARVEHPTERFGEVVGRIKGASNKPHKNVTIVFPILDGEKLDKNMTRALSRDARINHVDGGLVVTVEDSGRKLGKTKFGEDGPEVAGLFGSGDRSVELSLCGASGSGRLGFTFVRDAAASEKEGIAGSGAALAQVISMGGVEEAGELGIRRKRREGRVGDRGRGVWARR